MARNIALLFATYAEVPDCIPQELQFQRYRFGDSDVAVVVSGIGRWNAQAAAAEVCRELKPECLIGSGVCGSAAGDIRIGDLLVADAVQYGGLELAVNPRNAAAVIPQHIEYRTGRFQTFDYFVTSRNAVLEGSIGVDMESYGVVAAAVQYGTPVAIARAVSDLVGAGELSQEGFLAARETLNALFRAFLLG